MHQVAHVSVTRVRVRHSTRRAPMKTINGPSSDLEFQPEGHKLRRLARLDGS